MFTSKRKYPDLRAFSTRERIALSAIIIFAGVVVAVWLRTFYLADCLYVAREDGYGLWVETGWESVRVTFTADWPGPSGSSHVSGNVLNGLADSSPRTPSRTWSRHVPGVFLAASSATIAWPQTSAWHFYSLDMSWPLFLALPIPLALMVLLFRARRMRRIKRFRRGQCPVCRYDLRATPDRCPECGTVVPVRLRIQSSSI